MCLAVPGRIVSLVQEKDGFPAGEVDFQGSRVEACFALVPHAQIGEWVLVHAGFAIALLNEEEARETWSYLEEAGLAKSVPEIAFHGRTGARS